MSGDFALYPDASHVGMIVGRNEAGKLPVCHCSYDMNNVVVMEFAASGFIAVEQQVLAKRISFDRKVTPLILKTAILTGSKIKRHQRQRTNPLPLMLGILVNFHIPNVKLL